jgi:hypothetical protein
VIQRAPLPAAADGSSPPPAAAANEPVGADGIAELADRVYALIVERIAREGERRGKWS